MLSCMNRLLVALAIFLTAFSSCQRSSASKPLFGTYQEVSPDVVEVIILAEDMTFQHRIEDRKTGKMLFSEKGTFVRNGGLLTFSQYRQFYDPMIQSMNTKGESFISYKMHLLYLDDVPLIKPAADQDYSFNRL